MFVVSYLVYHYTINGQCVSCFYFVCSSVVVSIHERISMRFVLVVSLLLPDTARVPVTHLIEDFWIRSCSGALAEDPRVVHDLIAVHARIRIHN